MRTHQRRRHRPCSSLCHIGTGGHFIVSGRNRHDRRSAGSKRPGRVENDRQYRAHRPTGFDGFAVDISAEEESIWPWAAFFMAKKVTADAL